MKKSHIATLLIFLLIIPATLYFGLRLTGRAYYLTSTLVIIEIIVPFLLAFESRKPQARELVVIAVLSALAVAARVVIPIPNFKAIFAIIMLSGMAFGPEAGFLVGAVSAFASNFFFGQTAIPPGRCLPTGQGACWRASCSQKADCRKSAGLWLYSASLPVSCSWARCWTPARYS